jgi:hypothetical protein
MSLKQSAASRTEVGPVQTAAVGPDQTAVPSVAVIAFRCGLCDRRGYDFALIPGSRFIHRAFEQAGVTDLLPFQEDHPATPQLPALVLGHRSVDGCRR